LLQVYCCASTRFRRYFGRILTSGQQYRKLRDSGSGEPPVLGDFWKFVTKIIHFRHISAKLNLKFWNFFIIIY